MASLSIDLKNISFDNSVHKKYDQSFITRYVIVTEIVNQIRKATGKRRLKILDLGGYNGAARQLLPNDKVTILDVFEDDSLDDYIQVSEVGIPCNDNEFDVVISTDVIEHIPSDMRERFVGDAVRVAKFATIIAAPFENKDGGVALEEAIANNMYIGLTGTEYSWLKEHHEYKLPTQVWMERFLRNKGITYAKTSHSTPRLWSELIVIGYFIANNISTTEKRIAGPLKKLNDEYFLNISPNDFPNQGYRTIYVMSKIFDSIHIEKPMYDKQAIIDFVGRSKSALGKAVSEMTRLNYEHKEDIKAHVALQSHLSEELSQLNAKHSAIVDSRVYRFVRHLKKVVYGSARKTK